MITRTKIFYKKHRKKFITMLILITIVELLFIPFNTTVSDLKNLPELGIALIFSELLFILGLTLMALSVEHDLGINPLRWRRHIKKLMMHIPNNRRFWLGFYINMSGALLTALILFVGIIVVLPVSAWGILWLPVADIVITLVLRASILQLRKEALLLNQ